MRVIRFDPRGAVDEPEIKPRVSWLLDILSDRHTIYVIYLVELNVDIIFSIYRESTLTCNNYCRITNSLSQF